MRNAGFNETKILTDALESIRSMLPASWGLEVLGPDRASLEMDAMVDFVSPSRRRVSFMVEVKRSGSISSATLVSTLRDRSRRSASPVLLLSDYVGPSLRAALDEAGIGYADATGWVRVTSEEPLILLRGAGAPRAPKADREPALVRLNGVATNRIIRTLVSTPLPIGVRDLAAAAEASPGSVSKLMSTLAREDIVERDARGTVTRVRARALIRRWTVDYSFVTTNYGAGFYLAPRGLDRTLTQLGRTSGKVALTGSAAARRLLPPETTSVVPLRLMAAYTDEPGGLAQGLGLVDADPMTANVVLAAPQDPQILGPADQLPLAPIALVLADLLTLPNRSDAEADQLMGALARDDAIWES